MPVLKRLASVVAMMLFVLLGALSNASADVAADQPGTGPATPTATGAPGGPNAEQPPLLPAPGPPPARHPDPIPDNGPPIWLWIALGLAACGGGWVAMLWMRGSRSPANSEPLLESTAELVAVGRQTPLVRMPEAKTQPTRRRH